MDGAPGESDARAVARMTWKAVEHGAAYPELRLGAGCLLLVHGPPGTGKSSFACLLTNAIKGPVVLISAEEGLSPTLAERLRRCSVRREDFRIVTRANVDQAVAYAQKHRCVAAILDSVQESTWSARDLRHALEVVPSMDLLVAVLQVTKEGLPAGSNSFGHECDVRVETSDPERPTWALRKSRYQEVAGVGGTVLPGKELPNAAA